MFGRGVLLDITMDIFHYVIKEKGRHSLRDKAEKGILEFLTDKKY
jgi:hypothetical protein